MALFALFCRTCTTSESLILPELIACYKIYSTCLENSSADFAQRNTMIPDMYWCQNVSRIPSLFASFKSWGGHIRTISCLSSRQAFSSVGYGRSSSLHIDQRPWCMSCVPSPVHAAGSFQARCVWTHGWVVTRAHIHSCIDPQRDLLAPPHVLPSAS